MRKITRNNTVRCGMLLGILFFTVQSSNGSDFKQLSGDISAQEFNPTQKYYIANSDIVVPKGKNAVLPAGIVICFRPGTSLRINGSCSINGTAENRTVLTSLNDSLYCTSPEAPGIYDWNGIIISPAAEKVDFNHIDIKYSQNPLVSEAQKLILNGVRRFETASPFFIINEQQINVQEDSSVTLEYPTSPAVKIPSPDLPVVADMVDDVPPPVPPRLTPPIHTEYKPFISKNVLRWSLFGTGTAALLTCGATTINCTIKHTAYREKYEDYKSSTGPDSKTAYDKAESLKKSSYHFGQASIISGIAGVILLSGFGLTYYF